MKKELVEIVRQSRGYDSRLGTMEKLGRAIGRWVVWDDTFYRIEKAIRQTPHSIGVEGITQDGKKAMLPLSHMTTTYDLDNVFTSLTEAEEKTMDNWEAVAGLICEHCHQRPATHWHNETATCCQCHNKEKAMWEPQAAEAHHEQVLAAAGRPWDRLGNKQKDPFYTLAETVLDDLLYCSRVWEAWGVGTMSESDFHNAAEDNAVTEDVAKILYNHHRRVLVGFKTAAIKKLHDHLEGLHLTFRAG